MISAIPGFCEEKVNQNQNIILHLFVIEGYVYRFSYIYGVGLIAGEINTNK